MPRNDAVPTVHCLRISKTGTTTLKTLIADNNIRRDIKACNLSLHGHTVSMPEVLQNPNNNVAFFLREPLARFVSGFNHRASDEPRRRQNAINNKETKVLKHFATPNDLAEALTSPNEVTQDRAYLAMSVQMHARLHYTDWLVGVGYLESRMHRITFIGFLESYAEDVRRFLRILGVERDIEIPHERRSADSSPRELSDLAQQNLRRWYADDIAIFEWAMQRRLAAESPPSGPAPAEAASPPAEPESATAEVLAGSRSDG